MPVSPFARTPCVGPFLINADTANEADEAMTPPENTPREVQVHAPSPGRPFGQLVTMRRSRRSRNRLACVAWRREMSATFRPSDFATAGHSNWWCIRRPPTGREAAFLCLTPVAFSPDAALVIGD